MIDKSEIKRLTAQCGGVPRHGIGSFLEDELYAFAKIIYKNGQDEQREKDAQICEDTDDEYFCGELRKTQYVCADAIRNASPESDGCEIVEYSSRMCERGTKSCVKKHAHAESDIDQATRTE